MLQLIGKMLQDAGIGFVRLTEKVAGLNLKQNLFEGVLNADSDLDSVDFSAVGKAQFLKQLEESIEEFTSMDSSEETFPDIVPEQKKAEEKTLADLIDEDESSMDSKISIKNGQSDPSPVMSQQEKAAQMEEVLNNGMDFFSGLFKMTTGKESGFENRHMEIDQETGEVVLRFKIG